MSIASQDVCVCVHNVALVFYCEVVAKDTGVGEGEFVTSIVLVLPLFQTGLGFHATVVAVIVVGCGGNSGNSITVGILQR